MAGIHRNRVLDRVHLSGGGELMNLREQWRRAWPDIWDAIRAGAIFWAIFLLLVTAPSWTRFIDEKVVQAEAECAGKPQRVWVRME